MLYIKKAIPIKANQYLHPATAPIGVHAREDGTSYVTTIHGDQINVFPGDWILPEGDGIHFYPVRNDVFKKTYDKYNG